MGSVCLSTCALYCFSHFFSLKSFVCQDLELNSSVVMLPRSGLTGVCASYLGDSHFGGVSLVGRGSLYSIREVVCVCLRVLGFVFLLTKILVGLS